MPPVIVVSSHSVPPSTDQILGHILFFVHCIVPLVIEHIPSYPQFLDGLQIAAPTNRILAVSVDLYICNKALMHWIDYVLNCMQQQ